MVLMFPGSLWTTSITWSYCGKNLPWKWEERDLEPGECEPPDLCPWPSLQLLHMAVLYNYIQQNLKKSLVQSSTLLLSQLLFSHNAFPWKKGWVWKKKTPPYLVRSLVFLATEQQPFTRTFHLSWRRFDPMTGTESRFKRVSVRLTPVSWPSERAWSSLERSVQLWAATSWITAVKPSKVVSEADGGVRGGWGGFTGRTKKIKVELFVSAVGFSTGSSLSHTHTHIGYGSSDQLQEVRTGFCREAR